MAKRTLNMSFNKAMISVEPNNDLLVVETDKECGELCYNLTEILKELSSIPNLSIKISYDNNINPSN